MQAGKLACIARMFHVYVTTTEVVIRIEPGYATWDDAAKAVADFHTRKKLIWARYDDSPFSPPGSWRAFSDTSCRWCHIVPNGNYTNNAVEGKFV